MTEEQFTAECFRWWDVCYPEYRGLLFHVPNGGARRFIEANKFKAMGVFPGVSDFILLWKGTAHCLELKVGEGKQSKAQEYWQSMVESEKIKYYLIKDLKTFTWTVQNIIGR